MSRKNCGCAICETSNLASICPACVNYRLNEYCTILKSLERRRDYLYSRLSDKLVAKGKADAQLSWKMLHNEKLTRLREKLNVCRDELSQGQDKKKKLSDDLTVQLDVLDSAKIVLKKNQVDQLEKSYPNWICTQSLGHMAITSERLHKQSLIVKQICKLFPQCRVKLNDDKKDRYEGLYDVICNARLPRGLDPHSVPSDELAASLGYMVQLLNLIVQSLALPALHNSGFAGSCSRIWQRDSYWNARPSSRSNEYPLFIPRQNCCSTGGKNSWPDRSSSNFEVTSIESETHRDLQKGIALLKKSVACITSYCYNSLCLDMPADASTFEAFAKLLAILSSSKEVRSVVSLKTASSRSKQVQQPNKSVWNVNSTISSSVLLESSHTHPFTKLPNSSVSFLYATDVPEVGKNESLIEGWDLVEHPTLSPPSETKDIEHWTPAMFTDATKYKCRSKQVQQRNKSVWNVNSTISSSALLESSHAHPFTKLPNSSVSFLYATDVPEVGKNESLIEGWDLVEHLTLPPPSETEDIEHWTRAMFTDATKYKCRTKF